MRVRDPNDDTVHLLLHHELATQAAVLKPWGRGEFEHLAFVGFHGGADLCKFRLDDDMARRACQCAAAIGHNVVKPVARRSQHQALPGRSFYLPAGAVNKEENGVQYIDLHDSSGSYTQGERVHRTKCVDQPVLRLTVKLDRLDSLRERGEKGFGLELGNQRTDARVGARTES